MRIVCPHCTMSYAVDAQRLGSGRTVRCAKCKEQWFARAEAPALAEAGALSPMEPADGAAALQAERSAVLDPAGRIAPVMPVVESPSIAAGLPHEASPAATANPEIEIAATSPPGRKSPKTGRARKPLKLSLPALCAAMGALVAALVMWRADVVRLMPQTAIFYKTIGLQVNLRGMLFKDLKVVSETVEGKPVMVIEGIVVSASKTPVELPRLRFAVRDQQGQEIYAWNAILDQASLQPGETAFFRSRLAAPPPEGRHIDVRFFNKRDLAAAGGKA